MLLVILVNGSNKVQIFKLIFLLSRRTHLDVVLWLRQLRKQVLDQAHHSLTFLDKSEGSQLSNSGRKSNVRVLLDEVKDGIDVDYFVASLLVIGPLYFGRESWVIAIVVDLTHQLQQFESRVEVFCLGSLQAELLQLLSGFYGEHL